MKSLSRENRAMYVELCTDLSSQEDVTMPGVFKHQSQTAIGQKVTLDFEDRQKARINRIKSLLLQMRSNHSSNNTVEYRAMSESAKSKLSQEALMLCSLAVCMLNRSQASSQTCGAIQYIFNAIIETVIRARLSFQFRIAVFSEFKKDSSRYGGISQLQDLHKLSVCLLCLSDVDFNAFDNLDVDEASSKPLPQFPKALLALSESCLVYLQHAFIQMKRVWVVLYILASTKSQLNLSIIFGSIAGICTKPNHIHKLMSILKTICTPEDWVVAPGTSTNLLFNARRACYALMYVYAGGYDAKTALLACGNLLQVLEKALMKSDSIPDVDISFNPMLLRKWRGVQTLYPDNMGLNDSSNLFEIFSFSIAAFYHLPQFRNTACDTNEIGKSSRNYHLYL